jgi:hypothetical protein
MCVCIYIYIWYTYIHVRKAYMLSLISWDEYLHGTIAKQDESIINVDARIMYVCRNVSAISNITHVHTYIHIYQTQVRTCKSFWGFQSESKMMTVSADVKLMPMPPALVQIRKMKLFVLGSLYLCVHVCVCVCVCVHVCLYVGIICKRQATHAETFGSQS